MTTPLPPGYRDRAVPRYTSYPTAPHFGSDVDEPLYRDWLGRLDPASALSLYLHVPFCKEMCWYCGCNMKLARRAGPVADYAAMLKREVGLLADALPSRMPISHLHWGGGTPTTLSQWDFADVMGTVEAAFSVRDDAERAIECDPRTLSDAMIAQLGALGFTRGSFGVQEFDPTVQQAINRVQPYDMVVRAVDKLRAAGVGAINFDLIYGLPHQTVETLTRTIALCGEIRPNRIALFGYAHVPWRAKQQRLIPEHALPDAAARTQQAEAAEAALIAAGYVPIGLDHFALPDDPLAVAARTGTLHRNFQGYTDDTARTLLGVGATSIGRTPAGYVQNIAETGAWARQVAAGHLPVAKGRALSREDVLRGYVIERLMCDGAVDTAEAGRRFGASEDWAAPELAHLSQMERDGLVRCAGPRVTVTALGARLVRVVAAVFDAYLAPPESGQGQPAARHSAAV